MSYLLALDQGTTSSRAIVFTEDGRLLACAQRPFQQYFPKPGWVEHDANEIWATQAAVITEVLAKANLSGRDIACVGIANQRETTVVWDRKTGQPICPAIVWQDRRTAPMCDQLRAKGLEETFRQRTGLVLDAYFSGTKLAWILDQVPDARQRAEAGELAFGTIDSWLVHKLTNGQHHLTDPSNASRTLLYNLHDCRWDDELLSAMNIPRRVLPKVVPSSGQLAEITGLAELKGIPIGAIIGDQQAATMGQLCTKPGLAKNTYGTGCFLLANTGNQPIGSDHQLLTTIAWCHNEMTTYALEGSVFVGGAVVQWLRDGLGLIQRSEEIEVLAQSVPDTDGVFFVPALTGLGAPHWDPYARGTIVGLTRGTTAAHLARAALEGIAFQVADLVDAMTSDTGQPMLELRVDGGASANDLLMQIQADILQTPVVRPRQLETTALGAAYLAGLGAGVYPSIDELQSHRQIERTFEPEISPQQASDMRQRWREAVERARGWAVESRN